MSSSSSSSSSSVGSSSSADPSSSSSRVCDANCAWVFDTVVWHDWVLVNSGCLAPNCVCSKPSFYGGDLKSTVQCTECKPVNEPSSSSSGGVFAAMAAPPSAAPFQATAILPDRANPSVFARVNVPLTAGGVSRLVAGGLGWLLTFWNRPSQVLGSSQTDPSVQPVDFPNPSDGALAVGVCLPQNGAMNQYWVCITDSQPWMQLQVDEWTILFMKLGN